MKKNQIEPIIPNDPKVNPTPQKILEIIISTALFVFIKHNPAPQLSRTRI
jgi:hypothetical protein